MSENIQDARSVSGPGVRRDDADRQQREIARTVDRIDRDNGEFAFSAYARLHLHRSILQRMSSERSESLGAYLFVLEHDAGERRSLKDQLLVRVTRFFRDRSVFYSLAARVIPELVDRSVDGNAIRLWIPGCSTGEEAWSLAILMSEAITRADRDADFRIFATDLDAGAVGNARRAVYSPSIAKDVAPERLSEFFLEDASGYRVRPSLRSHLVFGVQNVVSDPCISGLDLVACRNVFIYLARACQQQVLSAFHYALNPLGILVLGAPEGVGFHSTEFKAVDSTNCIYRRLTENAR